MIIYGYIGIACFSRADYACRLGVFTFGVDFNSLWDTFVSAETLDSVFSAIADVLKPIIEMFSGVI
ncbi:MAG: hypothetical protein E7555_03070 [Ruminococcaceae bacterium]|nr:hypothetical protein [Oscillospiraceae bacterium]